MKLLSIVLALAFTLNINAAERDPRPMAGGETAAVTGKARPADKGKADKKKSHKRILREDRYLSPSFSRPRRPAV